MKLALYIIFFGVIPVVMYIVKCICKPEASKTQVITLKVVHYIALLYLVVIIGLCVANMITGTVF